jgi:hypothetical protein
MRGKVKELEGGARKSFLNLLDEARDHLEAWQRVAAPVRLGQDRFERIRPQFRSALNRALAATADLIANGDHDVKLGAALLGRVLEPLRDQIDGAAFTVLDHRHRLDIEIALLPEFPINGRTGFEVTLSIGVPSCQILSGNNITGAEIGVEAAIDGGPMVRVETIAFAVRPVLLCSQRPLEDCPAP